MKTTVTKWASKAAGAGAVALLLATPAFAQQSRGDWNRNNDDQRQQSRDTRGNDNRSRDNNNYRENQRINTSGRISAFSHERDGYRIRLEGNDRSFWVPQSSFGSRARDLRVGVSIGFGGIFRGGSVYVDAVSWPNDGYAYGNGYGYDRSFVRGVIERVDRRDGTLLIREQGSGRVITADTHSDLRGLRRGERVELRGQWIRGGVFEVTRFERR